MLYRRFAADAFGNALGESLARANWGGSGQQSGTGSGSESSGMLEGRIDGSESTAAGKATILDDGSIRGSDGVVRRPGGYAVNLGGRPDNLGKLLGWGSDGQPYYAEKEGAGFTIDGLLTNSNYSVTAKPSYLTADLAYSFDSSGQAFWRDRGTGEIMSPRAPYAMPTLGDLQTADVARGLWNGVTGLPGAAWEGVKTIGEGYRAIGYLVTGNIGSYESRSSLTGEGMLRAAVENTPVGVLGSMFDGRYDIAGQRMVGTAVGVGLEVGTPYLNKVPGLN